MRDEKKLLVSRKETAKMLEVSEMTLRRLKSLEPVRLRPNGKVFYRLADVLALINGRKKS